MRAVAASGAEWISLDLTLDNLIRRLWRRARFRELRCERMCTCNCQRKAFRNMPELISSTSCHAVEEWPEESGHAAAADGFTVEQKTVLLIDNVLNTGSTVLTSYERCAP